MKPIVAAICFAIASSMFAHNEEQKVNVSFYFNPEIVVGFNAEANSDFPDRGLKNCLFFSVLVGERLNEIMPHNFIKEIKFLHPLRHFYT